jgi:molybdate transport system substrate-binding protein
MRRSHAATHRLLPSPSLALAGVVALLAASCGSSSRSTGASPAAVTSVARGSITVSAASSLTEAFTRIGADFDRRHPGTSVRFNFGSSSALGIQIDQGAPADVFASADLASVDTLVTSGRITGRPLVFARNQLVIVTKPGNPERVRSLDDLTDLRTVALCADTVPCGKYAARVLDRAGVAIPETHVTRGQDVKAAAAAVTTGDADAALVYRTDAVAAGDAVTTLAIPSALNATATYAIAVLSDADHTPTARAFVRAVTSAPAHTILRSFGFLPAR